MSEIGAIPAPRRFFPLPFFRSSLSSFPALRAAALCGLGLVLLGCEFKVSTARVSEATMARDAGGQQPTTTFSPTEVFFVAGQLANAPAGTTVRATWIAVAVNAPGVAPNFQLDSTELTGASGPFNFQLSNDSPWPEGTYRVELALDGEPELTLDFSVAPGAVAAPSPQQQPAGTPPGAAPQTAPTGSTPQGPAPRGLAPQTQGPTAGAFQAPPPRPTPDTVLSSRGGHSFRQGQLDQGLEMIRFLSGSPATAAEAERLRLDALRQFENDPVEFAEGMDFIEQVLTAARSTTDAAEIAGYRMVLFNVLYTANQQLPADERPALLEIVFEKNPVLAYDPSTQLTLTTRDLRGAVEIYAFGSGVSLGDAEISRQ
ncbi:MAG: hypothetical protein AAGF23_18585, partial [Acidobacteriota bacterium]